MKILGVELSGSDCILAVLETDGASVPKCLAADPPKITLSDERSGLAVKSVFSALEAVVREHAIDIIAIKARNKKGRFAGGGVSFKLEGLVQMLPIEKITFFAANKIAKDTDGVEFPPHLNQYQRGAFGAAYCAVEVS